MDSHREELAILLTNEQGKTYLEALGEVEDTIQYITESIDTAKRITGDICYNNKTNDNVFIHKVPYGVSIALCGFNYPLALVGRKIGPALITGNTVIVKPHEVTPLATAKLFELIEEANFPKGVINLITGTGIASGDRLVKSDKTRLVSLTGSIVAGKAVYKASANNIAKLILELGGKAPFIVLEDADLEEAADAVIASRFPNCGQVCICADMVFVQEKIAEEFTKMILERVKKIKVGNPMNKDTNMGPKISKGDLDKIKNIVDKTIEAGGKLVYGGKRPEGSEFEKGHWYEPTIITDVTFEMPAAKEEIFGPVLPIIKIKDIEDCIRYAKESEYGLACYLYTNNNKIINEAYRKFEVGTIFVNRPMTAYMHVYHNGHKLSGINGEDGEYGLNDFLQKRVIYQSY